METQAIIQLIHDLMDNNRSHQWELIRRIWYEEHIPTVVSKYKFNELIRSLEPQVCRMVFDIISYYMIARVFDVKSILKDETAIKKYYDYT